ncbi:MAG: family 20 glycosylhydrolase, partial [Clostridia bacterium]|nr:family 20 glycosylhydrolase [Clostridia bacterium]
TGQGMDSAMAEIKEMDAYAKSKGIELMPCIQTLAHFTNLVRHAVYRDIVDTQDILLIDEPKTYELIEKMFKTIAENFTSRNVNIGMDEAHFVGLGKYLDKHGYQDRYDILIRHLHKVADIAKKYGFKAHMWSDMIFKLADNNYTEESAIPDHVKKLLPDNVDLCFWDYYHGNKDRYDGMFERHAEFGHDVWFAGGAWSWLGFAPLSGLSLYTMKPAMESVREHGVKHVIMTMWGDDGKECSFFSLLHTLYTIRQYADGNFDQEKIAKGFYALFKVKYEDFELLDLPNKDDFNDTIQWQKQPCKALLYCDPFMGAFDQTVASKRPIPYAQYAEVLAKAAKRVGKFDYLFDMEAKLCHALAIKAELGVNVRRAYHSKDNRALAVCVKNCSVLKKRLKAFHQSLYTLWNKENKPQGWEIQDARIGGLIMRIDTCQKRLKEYLSGKVANIPELEEEVLKILDGSQIAMNNYGKLVSFNGLHFGLI